MRRAIWIAPLFGALALAGHLTVSPAHGWFDETHIAVAKVVGYSKWFNACGPDMIKVKMGDREKPNHYANNPRGTTVTPEMVLAQTGKYDQPDDYGHLYGAIVASVREYIKESKEGKYGEYHMAFCAHYVGDLSQPLHNTEYNLFNETHHKELDGTVNDEVLGNLANIKIYPIKITSEKDLVNEIARVANLSMALGYRLEDENRLLTRSEAYRELGHSASLFKAIFEYAREAAGP